MSNCVELKDEIIGINNETATCNNINLINTNTISTKSINSNSVNTDLTINCNGMNSPSYSKLFNSNSTLNHLLSTNDNKYAQSTPISLYSKDNKKLTKKAKLIQNNDEVILNRFVNFQETLKDQNNVISMNIKKRSNNKIVNDKQERISKKEICRRKIWKQILIDIKMKTPRFRSICSDRQFQMKTIAVNCQNHYLNLNKYMKK